MLDPPSAGATRSSGELAGRAALVVQAQSLEQLFPVALPSWAEVRPRA